MTLLGVSWHACCMQVVGSGHDYPQAADDEMKAIMDNWLTFFSDGTEMVSTCRGVVVIMIIVWEDRVGG